MTLIRYLLTGGSIDDHIDSPATLTMRAACSVIRDHHLDPLDMIGELGIHSRYRVIDIMLWLGY